MWLTQETGSRRINIAVGVLLSLLLNCFLLYLVNRSSVRSHPFVAIPVLLTWHKVVPPPVRDIVRPPEEKAKYARQSKQQLAQTSGTAPKSSEAQVPAQLTATAPPAPGPSAPEAKAIDARAINVDLGRALADVDREKRDTAVGQLMDKPLYPPESGNEVAAMIEKTHRRDCRGDIMNQYVLAPLILAKMALLDKKDSGCKW